MNASEPAPLANKTSQTNGGNRACDLTPDTTRGSVFHQLARLEAPGWGRGFKIYVVCIAVTFAPLLLTGWLEAHPLAAMWERTGDNSLPLLLDANIAFTFLVSFPVLMLLLVSDHDVLSSALRKVCETRAIAINEPQKEHLRSVWRAKFRRVNVLSLALGIPCSAALSWLTLRAYVWSGAGFWAISGTDVLMVGRVYLYCITLLYALITIYVARCICIAFFLRDVIAVSEINMLPFHPDGSGGLRPLGQVGLRNQYTLTILGLNIMVLAAITSTFLTHGIAEQVLIASAGVIYLVLGPIVFMGPLLPFRSAMQNRKLALLSEVTDRLRAEFERIRAQLPTMSVSQSDVDNIERLRKVVSMIDELPVWPFDARTLKKFASAYAMPLALPAVAKLVALLVP